MKGPADERARWRRPWTTDDAPIHMHMCLSCGKWRETPDPDWSSCHFSRPKGEPPWRHDCKKEGCHPSWIRRSLRLVGALLLFALVAGYGVAILISGRWRILP
jgi:hypothetical protein